MRSTILAILFVVAQFTGAAAQQDGGGAAREVISSQIEAFRADDLATAFGYASPAIQGAFGDPERFGLMVRQGYPMVGRPGELTFLDAETTGGGMRQRVMVRDATGAIHILAYYMKRIGAEWRIDGVEILDVRAFGV